jgi:uncharacterized membrane protein
MSGKRSANFRIVEIDITKGFAALLMIAAHGSGGNTVLPFGNFGAALFFFCSGMNTLLFLRKNIYYSGTVLFNFLFALILFLGGYTQIVIAHPHVHGFIPAFLQFNALGVVLILLIFKICRNPVIVGLFFPLPFILHILYQLECFSFLSSDAPWMPFVFGRTGFPLFPWSGFLLFGAFMLNLRERPRVMRWVLFFFALISSISIWILRIPVKRIDMSLSYILLALFVLAFLFFLFHQARRLEKRTLVESARRQLALVGRNSLMFVYLHYFILYYLIPGIPDFSDFMEMAFQALIGFAFCFFAIYIYEKVKFDMSLFFPVTTITFLLIVLRYSNYFVFQTGGNIMDMTVGILFAFLYIQLRKKFRFLIKSA